MQHTYKPVDNDVTKDGGIIYHCDSRDEAKTLAKICNDFKRRKKKDHVDWDELMVFMRRFYPAVVAKYNYQN